MYTYNIKDDKGRVVSRQDSLTRAIIFVEGYISSQRGPTVDVPTIERVKIANLQK
jgi:hypothetical protein